MIVIVLEESVYLAVKYVQFDVFFIFCFYIFYLILEKIWENFVFLVTFDTCDVVYNWFIYMLPPIVLDNLFGSNK